MSSPAVLEKYAKLIDVLYERTLDGAIDWKYDEVLDDLSVVIGNIIVSIDEKKSSRETIAIFVTIRNRDGTIVDSFNDEDFPSPPESDSFHTYFQYMKDLRIVAMRRATGADKVIDELIKNIEQMF